MDAYVNSMKYISFDAKLHGVYSDIQEINMAIMYNFLLTLQVTWKSQKNNKFKNLIKKWNLKL